MRFHALTAPEGVPAARLGALKRLYVVLVLQPPAPDEALEPAYGRVVSEAEDEERRFEAYSRPLTRPEARGLLNDVLAELSTTYTGVAAWQLAYPDEPPKPPPGLEPTAVLRLEPSELKGDKSDQDDPIYDPSGIQTGTRKVLRFQASFRLAWRLDAWPSGEKIGSGVSDAVDQSTESSRRSLAAWMAGKGGLIKLWREDLRRQLLPHAEERFLDLARGKDEEGKEAVKAAGAGQWDRAEELWRKAAARGDEAALYDLGVAAERRGARGEALEHYRRALERSRGGPRERAVRERLLEVEPTAGLEAGQGGGGSYDWFEEPTAVLPFSAAPEHEAGAAALRLKANEELRKKGYRVQPQLETDRLLTAAGLGPASDPAALAKALSVRKLLYGQVEDYAGEGDESGGKVSVAASLRLSGPEGGALWSGRGVSVRELGPKGTRSSLASGAASPNLQAALALAVSAAVQWASETLPARGGAKAPPPRMEGRP